MGDDTIWTDSWDEGEDWSGGGARAKRLPRGDELGATVYELGPGNWLPFHFHHGSEEYLVVLRGRPTLRTGDGSSELAEGDAVHFPRGPDGTHGLANETDEPVRLLMARRSSRRRSRSTRTTSRSPCRRGRARRPAISSG